MFKSTVNGYQINMATRRDSTIRIIAPLSHADEARVLPGLGADELYFSIQPAGAGVALNRRELPRANFARIEDAARAVALAHHRGARVFVALNKVFYTDAELPRVARILDQCLDAGVDGAIVADAGLLRRLRRERYPERLEIALSTVAAAGNREAVRFFADLGISRVVLPRTVDPDRAAALVRAFPGLIFEALIFNWYCTNLDGVCRFQHELPDAFKNPRVTANGCCLDYTVRAADGGDVPMHVRDRFRDVYQRSAAGCGACSVSDFLDAGVTHFKLAGRLLSSAAKEQSVTFLKGCRDIVSRIEDKPRRARLIRRHYETLFGNPCAGICYHGARAGKRDA